MTASLSRRGLLLAGGATAAGLAVGVPLSAAATPSTSGTGLVTAWNQTLLRIARTPGSQPPTVHPTRSFAILHTAIHNAVVATTGIGRPYRFAVAAQRHASPVAAAAQAAHDVLANLYPAFAGDLGIQLAAELSAVTNPRARAAGIRTGQVVARLLLGVRSGDGSSVILQPPSGDTEPGQYRPTPPAFAPAVFTHWPRVTPFLIGRADRFRPASYPALTNRRYAAATNEVKRLGQDTSTARTEDQTQQARFWSAPIWNYWNEITQSAVHAADSDLVDAARVFARLNLAFADAVIAFYEAKYHYAIWRPITAIRLAATDTNPATIADPGWNSLGATPADPAYPGAHSVISQAGAVLLGAEFGPQDRRLTVTSEVLPGVARRFWTYQDIADEAGLSRIYGGVHTRLDHQAGERLGRDVAEVALGQLRSRRH